MNFLQSFPWLEKKAPGGSGAPVVIASGIRLFRNLHETPFLERAGREEQLAISDIVKRALDELPDFAEGKELDLPIDPVACGRLLEQRLVTQNFSKMRFAGQALRLSIDRTEIALINGADHLVLCKFGAGMALPALWKKIDSLDNSLSTRLRFAFHPKYGYLSPDPGNVGTGMAASVILHLPGLALMDEIKPMLTACLRLNLKCCGIFDFENKFPGNLYVITNQSKLGESEDQLLARMEKTVAHIAEEELQARDRLFARTPMKAADFCYRSLAVLAQARMISSVEALNALSGLKLALDRSFAAELMPEKLPVWEDLMLNVMPGHVAASFASPEENTQEHRAIRRAEILRAVWSARS